MRRRWLKLTALLMAVLLSAQPAVEVMAAVIEQPATATPSDSAKGESLRQRWQDLMDSIDAAFEAMKSTDADEVQEFSGEAGPIEMELMEKIYGLAEKEQGLASPSSPLEEPASGTGSVRDSAQTANVATYRMTALAATGIQYHAADQYYYTSGPVEGGTLYLSTGEYHFRDIDFTSTSKEAVSINGTVTLYIDGKVKLKGCNGSGTTPGSAAIRVPAGSTLILKGNGNLTAIGGNAANGTAGANADATGNYIEGSENIGGRGGNGGGGAGAGIGGNGGAGGSRYSAYSHFSTGNGGAGESAGSIYIYGLNSLDVQGGTGGTGAKGGNGCQGASFTVVLYTRLKSGAGGGGGGAGGFAAAPIGGGGAGGGGGGDGADGDNLDITLAGLTMNMGGGYGGDGGYGYNGSGKSCGGGGGGGGGAGFNGAKLFYERGGAGGGPGVNGARSNEYDVSGENGGKTAKGGPCGGAGMRGQAVWLTTACNIQDGKIFNHSKLADSEPDDHSYITIYDMDDSKITVDSIAPQQYSGRYITPKPDVYWNGKKLEQKNFLYTYSGNQNVGRAEVKIEGLYNLKNLTDTTYTAFGSKTFNFDITKGDITPSIQAADHVEFGAAFIASVEGNTEGNPVTGWQFIQGEGTIKELSNGSIQVTPTKAEPIRLKAQVSEGQNYNGAEAISGEITVTGQSIEKATVETIRQQTYTGQAIRPKPKVYFNGRQLEEGPDYEIEYSDNVNVGTAKAIFIGKGNFGNRVEIPFSIVPLSITDSSITFSSIADQPYDGTALCPPMVLTRDGASLIQGTDYEVEYSGNVKVGTNSAVVIVRGMGNYKGTHQERFTITPASINADNIKADEITPEVFNGLKKEPLPVVRFTDKDGNEHILTKELDYTLSYSNHVEAGTASVTIQGTGNFNSSRTLTFTIQPKTLTVRANDHFLEYNAGLSEPVFSLTDDLTITGAVSGYEPEFTGMLRLDGAWEVKAGKMYQIVSSNLALSPASSHPANQNYSFSYGEGFTPGNLTIVQTTVIDKEAVLKKKTGGSFSELTQADQRQGWYNTQVYVCAPEHYLISAVNSLEDEQWGDHITYPDGDYITSGVTYFLKDNTGGTTNGAISKAKSIYFKQDTRPPEGSIIIGNQVWPVFMDTVEYNHYYNVPQDVELTASDDLSGVQLEDDSGMTQTGISYMVSSKNLSKNELDGLAEEQWTRGVRFRFEAEKGIVYVRVEDRAGNVLYLRSDGLIYDTKAPEIQITKTPGTAGSWVRDLEPKIEGKIARSASGLMDRYVTYEVGRLNDKGGYDYGYPFEFTPSADGAFTIRLPDLEDGKYQIRISASGNSGNLNSKEVSVWIDRSAPEVEMERVSVTPAGEWKKSQVTVNPAAAVSDAMSGISKKEYALDGNTFRAYTGDSFVINSDGVYERLVLRYTDSAGNVFVTQPGQIVVRLDTKAPAAPSVQIKGVADSVDTGGLKWYRGVQAPAATIQAPAYGTLEAPTSVQWKLWKNGFAKPAQYSTGVWAVPDNDGVWNLAYKTVDEAGNESAEQTETIRWDHTAPGFESPAYEITYLNSSTPAAIANMASFGLFFNETVRVKLNAKDETGGSGLAKIGYYINGVYKEIELSKMYFDLEAGTEGTIRLEAEDGAGNVTGTMILNADGNGNLIVEDNPPEIQVTAHGSPNENHWYNQNVKLSIEAYDADSGLAVVTGDIGGQAVNYVLNNYTKVKSKEFEAVLEEGKGLTYSLTAVDNGGLTGTTPGDAPIYNIDTTAPEVVMRMTKGQPSDWYNTDVEITAEASDSLSGIWRYSWSLDGGTTWDTPKAWDGDVNHAPKSIIKKEGTYTIMLRVWDQAGNMSETAELYADVEMKHEDGSMEAITQKISNQLTLDVTPPRPPVFNIMPGANGHFNGQWYNGGEPGIELKLPEGQAVGSKETLVWYITNEGDGIDLNAPGDGLKNVLPWNKPDGDAQQVTLPRDDWGAYSGPDGKTPEYGEAVQGAYDLYYFSYDGAGNVSYHTAPEITTIRWDCLKPEFGSFTFSDTDGNVIDGMKHFFQYGNYFKDSVTVIVEVEDPVPEKTEGHVKKACSGIRQVTFSINGGAPETAAPIQVEGVTKYTFEIPKETTGKITVQAVDYADNVSSRYVLGTNDSDLWALESTPPEIGGVTATSSNASREVVDGAGKKTLWYTEDISLNSVITDTGSGINRVTWQLGTGGEQTEQLGEDILTGTASGTGSRESTYTWKDILSEEGTAVPVHIKAYDNAGNANEYTTIFNLDKTKPDVEVIFGDPDGGMYQEYPGWNGDSRLTIKASDHEENGGSGVDVYAVSFDSGVTWSDPAPYKTGTDEFNMVMVPDGSYEEDQIQVRVWDIAGNCYDSSEEQPLSFNTDAVEPESGVVSVTPFTDGELVMKYGEAWYNGSQPPSIYIHAETTDPERAPVHVYWCLTDENAQAPKAADVSQWTKDSQEQLKIPKDGRYKLFWYLEDEAGNTVDKEMPLSQVIRYDSEKVTYHDPKVSFSRVNTNPLSRVGNFITSGNYFKEAVCITLHPQDHMSQPAAAFYSLDQGFTWRQMKLAKSGADVTFSFELNTDTDGTVQIWYYTVDKAGNAEAPNILTGQSGSLEWIAEEGAPEIGRYQTKQSSNGAGWFNASKVDITVPVIDRKSGVATATASCAERDVSGNEGPDRILDSGIWIDQSPAEYEAVLAPVLDFDCTDLAVTVTALDNSGNEAERTEYFSIDTVAPTITQMDGWPQVPVNKNQTVTFKAKDERSGLTVDSVTVTKDEDMVIIPVCQVDDGVLTGTFSTAGNGLYRIEITDVAGNTQTFTKDEKYIDLSKISDQKLEVRLEPPNPNGENGWYVTVPEIQIIPVKQSGASQLTTWYTLYPEGEEEPEGTVFLTTSGPGTTGAENQDLEQPKIPQDGRWKLHVWLENVFGDRTEFETRILVDTAPPENLRVTNLPKDKAFTEAEDVWIRGEKHLTAKAEDITSGIRHWCYSLDGGSSWTGWKDWNGSGSLLIDQDVMDEERIMFRVKDEAGNETVSSGYTALRDTQEPMLYLALINGMDTTMETDSSLLFYTNEDVWQIAGNNGKVRIWDYDSRTLFCEIQARTAGIDVNRRLRTVEVPLTVPLKPGTRYYVDITRDFVTDEAGNVNPYCGGFGVWEFTTNGTKVSHEGILGYNVDLLAGTEPEYRTRIQPVWNETDGEFQVICGSGNLDGGNGETVSFEIQPLTADGTAAELWAVSPSVSIEQMTEGIYRVEFPAAMSDVRLRSSVDERTAAESVLRIALRPISAGAYGDLNPAIEEMETVNSIRLQDRMEIMSEGKHIELRLDVKQLDNDGSVAAAYMLGGKLPPDSRVQNLDISFEKAEKQNGAELIPIERLEHPIRLTLDMPGACRGYEHYIVLRIHGDQVSYLRPQMLLNGTRFQFATDRFSQYALLCSNSPLIPEQRVDGTMTTTLAVASSTDDGHGKATSSEVVESQGSHIVNVLIPWWVAVIIAAAAAMLVMVIHGSYRRDHKKKENEEDS